MDERSRWYLEALVGRVHTTVMATVDMQGYPRTCAVDMMLADDDGVYFLTARGKSLYRRLSASGRVSVTGISGHDTMSSVALSLTGDAVEVGPDRLPELFEANPYMEEIYPDEGSRSALVTATGTTLPASIWEMASEMKGVAMAQSPLATSVTAVAPPS